MILNLKILFMLIAAVLSACKQGTDEDKESQGSSEAVSYSSGCRLTDIEHKIFSYVSVFEIRGNEFSNTTKYFEDGNCKKAMYSDRVLGLLSDKSNQFELIMKNKEFGLNSQEIVQDFSKLKVGDREWVKNQYYPTVSESHSDGENILGFIKFDEETLWFLPVGNSNIKVTNEEIESNGFLFLKVI